MKEITELQYERFRNRVISALGFKLNVVRNADNTKDETDFQSGLGITTEGTPKNEKRYNEAIKQVKIFLEENKNLNIKFKELKENYIRNSTLKTKDILYIENLFNQLNK